MGRINRLSQSLINKIAAGEVIERPASVVKELVENSLDAGASRIDITVEKGGVDYIRITDNGCGISPDDIKLAVTSHATSKLCEDVDLFHVKTMGFRGEALASVAEISHLILRSRVNMGRMGVDDISDTGEGRELVVRGGEYGEPQPCGTPPGTCIEVRNLFYNTPVRKKFLKSAATEFGHISEVVERLALINYGVHFTLRHNDRVIYDLSATTDWVQRISEIEGRELAENLIWVSSTFGDVTVEGYVARPNFSRSNAKLQHLFLNGRPIRDRSLQHALGEAYRGLLMVNRFPICFLSLKMPSGMVDVNVHPTKMEVRFQDSSTIYGQLLSTLRSKFLTTDLSTYVSAEASAGRMGSPTVEPVPEADPWRQDTMKLEGELQNEDTTYPLSVRDMPNKQASEVISEPSYSERYHVPSAPERSRMINNGGKGVLRTGKVPEFKPFDDGRGRMLTSMPFHPAETTLGAERNMRDTSLDIPDHSYCPENSDHLNNSEHPESSFNSASGISEELPEEEQKKPGSEPRLRFLQIHDRYIVLECKEGLGIIDQHALHERLLYEKLKESYEQRGIESQQLLSPEPVDLSPSDAVLILERQEELKRVGMEVGPFGGNTVVIHSVPSLRGFSKISASELLYDLLSLLQEEGRKLSVELLMESILHTIACKAAVKAGARLSLEEIESLLDEFQRNSHSVHCPHGRPAILIWSCSELDKMFERC